MWQYLLLLAFINKSAVSGDGEGDRLQQFRYAENLVGPKEQKIDKTSPCLHDEVL